MREAMTELARSTQAAICAALERIAGGGFREDLWQRAGGGGGLSRVLENGSVLEKAGVNAATVWGPLPPAAAAAMRSCSGGGDALQPRAARRGPLVLRRRRLGGRPPAQPQRTHRPLQLPLLRGGGRGGRSRLVVRRRRRPHAVRAVRRGRRPLPPRPQASLRHPRPGLLPSLQALVRRVLPPPPPRRRAWRRRHLLRRPQRVGASYRFSPSCATAPPRSSPLTCRFSSAA